MPKLDLTKPVQTRDGREVKQVTVFDCDEEFRVRGVVDGKLQSWTIDGTFHKDRHSPNCLVNVPERVKKTVYFRVANGHVGSKCNAVPTRIDDFDGYIRVDIDAEIIPFED